MKEGEPLLVLSAMKMETVIPSPLAGTVKRVPTSIGDNVDADDLLVLISEAEADSGEDGKEKPVYKLMK